MNLVERIKNLKETYLHKENKAYLASDLSASALSYGVAIGFANFTSDSTLSSLEKALLNSVVKTATYLSTNPPLYMLFSWNSFPRVKEHLKKISVGNIWGIVVADSIRIATYVSVLEFELAEDAYVPLIAYPLAGAVGKIVKYGINYRQKLIGTKDNITNF